MDENIIIALCTAGALFVLLAAIGLVRMPDFYLRLSVTTKAATLGIGLMLCGAAIYFNEISVTSRVVAIIIFLFLTAPVAAHMIGRSSYFIGTKLWKKSVIDELRDQYEKESHILKSHPDQEITAEMEADKE